MTLQETAAGGDRLVTLRALRDELATAIDERGSCCNDCTCQHNTTRDLAAVAARLQIVLAEIAALEKAAGTTGRTPLATVRDLVAGTDAAAGPA